MRDRAEHILEQKRVRDMLVREGLNRKPRGRRAPAKGGKKRRRSSKKGK